MKYYMSDDCEHTMTLEGFKETLLDELDEKIELREMERDIGGEMYCSRKEVFIEKWDCGFSCRSYNPSNGKSGRCRDLKNGFVETGRKFLLTKDGLEEIVL